MYTILVLDDSLGFLWWLGQSLGNAGYQVLPAQSPREARAWVTSRRIKTDVLIVDLALPGAVEFTQSLQAKWHPRVIALADAQGSDHRPAFLEVDGIGWRPAGLVADQKAEDEAVRQWLSLVRSVLEGGRTFGAT